MSGQGPPAVNPAPLVSVSITAFNSEKWLGRALDSVLLQQITFPIEIVIGDDCSTDGTVAVARSYQERNPGLIRILEQPKNLGAQRNYYETFEQCRGKYIAWLDADDYWTDPEKLTIQLQVMESNPSVTVCCHFVRAIAADGHVSRDRYPSIPPGRYGLAEVVRHNFLPSASVMIRNGIHRNLPKWYFDLAGLSDWPLLVVAGLAGDIILIDRLMADYVLTPGSAYMSKGSVYQDKMDVEFCERMETWLAPEWRRAARAAKGKRYESMAYALRHEGDFAASREAALKAFSAPAIMDNFASKTRALLVAVLSEAGARLRRRQPGP